MAKLVGQEDQEYSAHILYLAPIAPELDSPRDGYSIEILKNGLNIYGGSYDVHGWQLGHFYFYKMASAFLSVKGLANAEMNFSTYVSTTNAHIKEEPLLRLGVEWFSIFLSTVRHLAIDHPEKVSLEIFARTGNQEPLLDEPDILRRFWMATSVENAERFGRELYDECVRAEDRRKVLGIPAEED